MYMEEVVLSIIYYRNYSKAAAHHICVRAFGLRHEADLPVSGQRYTQHEGLINLICNISGFSSVSPTKKDRK